MKADRPDRFWKKIIKQERRENIKISLDEIIAFILLLIIVILYALSE